MRNIGLTNILNPIQTTPGIHALEIKLVATKYRTNINMNYLKNRILNIWNNLDNEIVNFQLFNTLKYRIININVIKDMSIMRFIIS